MKRHFIQSSIKIGSNYLQDRGPRRTVISEQYNGQLFSEQCNIQYCREAILGSCRRGKKVKRFMLLIAEKRNLQSHNKSISYSILVWYIIHSPHFVVHLIVCCVMSFVDFLRNSTGLNSEN